MKTTRIIAIAIAAAISASATSAAWAAKAGAFDEPRGSKTYLPGEGGCKNDSGLGWVTYGCD
jgi:hypothetical protein